MLVPGLLGHSARRATARIGHHAGFDPRVRRRGGSGVSTATAADSARAIASLWPTKSRRHQAYLALIGGLLRSGWPVERVEALVGALAEATQDEDGPASRVANVRHTAERLQSHAPVTGWPT